MMYVVRMMNENDYERYMSNEYAFISNTIEANIEATTEDEARAKAERTYNKVAYFIKSTKAIEEEKAKAEAIRKEYIATERKREATKIANEQARANEMAMTVEQYKEYKKVKANKKRCETEIRKAYEQIEAMKKAIAYNEQKIKEYEATMNEMAK